MENRFEKFTYLILKMAKMIQKIKNIQMEDIGLKAVHVMCLYHLSKHNDGLTNKELVDLTLEDKAAISRALTLLKEKDLISYEKGYNALIKLTDNGLKVANYIDLKSDEALLECGTSLTDLDRKQLYESLKKIESNMEAYCDKLLIK